MYIVECLSSSAYDERPVALTWNGQRLEVDSILADWRTPAEHRFRVRTADRRIFELAYHAAEDEWQIQPIQEK